MKKGKKLCKLSRLSFGLSTTSALTDLMPTARQLLPCFGRWRGLSKNMLLQHGSTTNAVSQAKLCPSEVDAQVCSTASSIKSFQAAEMLQQGSELNTSQGLHVLRNILLKKECFPQP